MNRFKKIAAAGALMVALTGCTQAEQAPQSTAAPVSAAQTTEAPEPSEVSSEPTEAPTEAVEVTSEPDTITDAELDDAAALLDELVTLDEGDYKRGFMAPMVKEIGKDEFCKAKEMQPNPDDEGGAFITVNPGGDFIMAMTLAAAFSENTTEDSYSQDDLGRLVTWTNEVYEAECDWVMGSTEGVESLEEEAAANEGLAESLGPDSVGAWDKASVIAGLDASDQATKDLVCEAMVYEGDASVFYGDEWNAWTGEEQQQAGLWAFEWSDTNCDWGF